MCDFKSYSSKIYNVNPCNEHEIRKRRKKAKQFNVYVNVSFVLALKIIILFDSKKNHLLVRLVWFVCSFPIPSAFVP